MWISAMSRPFHMKIPNMKNTDLNVEDWQLYGRSIGEALKHDTQRWLSAPAAR